MTSFMTEFMLKILTLSVRGRTLKKVGENSHGAFNIKSFTDFIEFIVSGEIDVSNH